MFQDDNFISFHDLTPEGHFLWASPSVTTILGYDPEEIAGTPAYDVIHKDDIAYVKVAHQENVLNELVGTQVVLRFKHKAGSWIPCMVLFSLCYDYIVTCSTVINATEGTIRKISAHSAAMTKIEFERIRRHHEAFGVNTWNPNILDPEPRACVILNRFSRNLGIMYASPSCELIFKLQPGQIVGKPFLLFIRADDLSCFVEQVDLAKSSNAVTHMRFWFQSPTCQREIPCEAMLFGAADGMIAILRRSKPFVRRRLITAGVPQDCDLEGTRRGRDKGRSRYYYGPGRSSSGDGSLSDYFASSSSVGSSFNSHRSNYSSGSSSSGSNGSNGNSSNIGNIGNRIQQDEGRLSNSKYSNNGSSTNDSNENNVHPYNESVGEHSRRTHIEWQPTRMDSISSSLSSSSYESSTRSSPAFEQSLNNGHLNRGRYSDTTSYTPSSYSYHAPLRGLPIGSINNIRNLDREHSRLRPLTALQHDDVTIVDGTTPLPAGYRLRSHHIQEVDLDDDDDDDVIELDDDDAIEREDDDLADIDNDNYGYGSSGYRGYGREHNGLGGPSTTDGVVFNSAGDSGLEMELEEMELDSRPCLTEIEDDEEIEELQMPRSTMYPRETEIGLGEVVLDLRY
ncbi:hypothetical protein BGX28_003712 [Mortierella sp. GBA30]|nr:hypothetical protein BGX28_003712 [Mortierella sp. GBA30]